MKPVDPSAIVVPLFRAGTRITPRMRLLFSPNSSTHQCIKLLTTADPIFKQNCLRIFTASLLAYELNSTLALVEGWFSNAIESATRPPRRVTGSYMSYLILKFLQRAQFTPYRGPVLRKNSSCCTWQEIDAVVQMQPTHFTAVANCPCPSRHRVERYVKLKRVANVTVLSPHTILEARNITLTTMQRELVQTLVPSARESIQGWIAETPNWLLHGVSHLCNYFFPKNLPLESWLANKLRSP